MKDIFNKRQRFSIRKFSVGVASVLIGVSLFAPTQGVLASTENSLPSVEKREAVQPILDNQNNPSSELDTRDVPIGSTRTTEPGRSGDTENNSLTTRDFVAGEDRSSTPAVRAASVPSSDIKKYELTEEDAKKIKAGIIGSEGDKYDSLLLDGEQLKPNGYTDNDYLSDKDEIYIYEKNGKKYVGYNSHPLLEDTDGDGIIDSDEKSDEKLKWNVSERDMIMFMELSYRDDAYIDKVLNHKKILTEADLYKKSGDTKPRYEFMMMNNELAPYWKRKKSYHTSSGLDAVLFETKSDFPFLPNGTAQVLAFRGTSDGKDIVADGVLGTGSNPQQGKDAEEIMRELAKDKSITNLYLTGHSLGGYLVQRAMVEAYELAYSDRRVMSNKEQLAYRNFYDNVLKKGTTFNAPKVRTGLFSSSEFWQKGLDSKKIAKAGKMTHYIVDNDSVIGKSVSNDRDVVINVGPTRGGHSSRSYFENDLINREPKFISGKRVSLDGIGFRNPKITTAKSLEKVGETVVYSKSGNDIIKSTTVSMKDPDTRNITKKTFEEVVNKGGAKDKVETTAIPSPKKYVKDESREKTQANVEVPGKTGEQTVTTTYSVNPNTGDLIEHVGQPVVKKPATETVVKVAAKDEVEYIKKGDDVVKKTTSYTVNSKTGSLTSTEKEEVVNRGGARDIVEYNSVEPTTVYLKDVNSPKGTNTVQFPGKAGKTKVTTTYSVNPVNGTLTPSKGKPEVATLTIARVVKVGAKDKVVETPIEPAVVYEKDGTRDFGTPDQRTEGKKGKTVTTTTYDVDPNDGHITEHVGNPVVTPAGKTIVKVGAKTKVEQSKDSEGRDVIDTTTYEVNPKTGKVTPTTVRTYGKTKEPTVEKRVVPSPVVYEKDESRDKDSEPVRKEGIPGEDTITTTYTVDPNTGKITASEGQPVRTKEPTNTIVKVPANDKVVENPIEPEVEYVRDGEREVDTPNERVEGAKGKTVTTTTYDVDSKDGHITEHVGNPVVTPAGKTIVKVGAKTKVEQSKDSEGRDVIDTTTYEVNPKTGKVTPTTVRTYGKTKEPTVEKRVVPSPVVYEKDESRDKDSEPVRKEGIPGEDTITTTYTVDPNTGKITASEGQPVRTKEPTNTIVKVAAKDKVETTAIPSPKKYVKDDTRDKDQPNVEEAGQAGSRTTTTTYSVDSTTGAITERVGEPVVVNPTETIVKVAAKDKVVETPIEPEVEYVKDVEKDLGTPVQRTEGEKGKTVTTTTYDVDPKDGHITEHVGNPVVSPAGKTIVKVGAKTKVEQSKDSEGLDVIDTTTYEVDPKTGKVTPTTVRTYGTRKEPKVELEQDPKIGDVTVTPKKPDGSTYPPGTTVEIPGKGDKPITVTIGEDGKGKVPNSELPEGKVPGTGKITEPGKPAVEVPVENPAKVTIFENGVLPASIELPELMIEVRWIDEDGNVLKPSVKTGNEKDAEHGSIPVYEFVRTVIDENEPVITHIFRKVSGTTNTNPVAPVTPDTNGSSGQDIPAPASPTPIPDVVTPNADPVDTKTTIDNGAKSNDSQNVLPNTGTESNITLASLGLLGMLGGLGLALGKKKED